MKYLKKWNKKIQKKNQLVQKISNYLYEGFPLFLLNMLVLLLELNKPPNDNNIDDIKTAATNELTIPSAKIDQ